MVYVEREKVLFASDTMMPVPSIVDGRPDAFRRSLMKIKELDIENIVQGHGEVILVGEVNKAVDASLHYLDAVEKRVHEAIVSGEPRNVLRDDNIESTGLSRLPLHGQVQQIHVANLLSLYDRKAGS